LLGYWSRPVHGTGGRGGWALLRVAAVVAGIDVIAGAAIPVAILRLRRSLKRSTRRHPGVTPSLRC